MKTFENEALWCSLRTVEKGRLAQSLWPCPCRSSMRCFHKWRAWSIFLITFFSSWMKLCISKVQFFFFVLSCMLRDKFFCDQPNRHIWKELLKEGAQEKKCAGVSNSIGKLFYTDSVYSDLTSLPYKLPLKLYSAIYLSILRKAHVHHFSQLRTFSLPSPRKPCRT